VNAEKFETLLSLAEQYVTEAAAIIQRQEHLISEMRGRGDDTKAAAALIETFQAAAHAMERHQQSMEQQLRALEGDKIL
jgi:hypothetical protein